MAARTLKTTVHARSTTVSPEKSRAQIEKAVKNYGGIDFGYATKAGFAFIWFHMNERQVRFALPMPDQNEDRFKFKMRNGKITKVLRPPAQRANQCDQAKRQAWRALRVVVIAKFEAVACGISQFETEFLGNIVLPGSQDTVADWFKPHLAQAHVSGAFQLKLSGGTN